MSLHYETAKNVSVIDVELSSLILNDADTEIAEKSDLTFYLENLDKLRPIIVDPSYRVIDGHHRALAARILRRRSIRAIVIDMPNITIAYWSERA
jgi:hypothetical protein